ncbi:hypothetical protein ES708_16285 [subsurface metagenome]
MNFQRKLIILIGIISIFLLLSSGCTLFITPDYDSYTVSKIKVIPTWANVKINTSKTFTVWAYDSEGHSIPVDPSKVYWSCSFQCPACGTVWELNPTSGSITTSFTPKKIGTYYIKATYKGKTDDSQINVY